MANKKKFFFYIFISIINLNILMLSSDYNNIELFPEDNKKQEQQAKFLNQLTYNKKDENAIIKNLGNVNNDNQSVDSNKQLEGQNKNYLENPITYEGDIFYDAQSDEIDEQQNSGNESLKKNENEAKIIKNNFNASINEKSEILNIDTGANNNNEELENKKLETLQKEAIMQEDAIKKNLKAIEAEKEALNVANDNLKAELAQKTSFNAADIEILLSFKLQEKQLKQENDEKPIADVDIYSNEASEEFKNLCDQTLEDFCNANNIVLKDFKKLSNENKNQINKFKFLLNPEFFEKGSERKSGIIGFLKAKAKQASNYLFNQEVLPIDTYKEFEALSKEVDAKITDFFTEKAKIENKIQQLEKDKVEEKKSLEEKINNLTKLMEDKYNVKINEEKNMPEDLQALNLKILESLKNEKNIKESNLSELKQKKNLLSKKIIELNKSIKNKKDSGLSHIKTTIEHYTKENSAIIDKINTLNKEINGNEEVESNIYKNIIKEELQSLNIAINLDAKGNYEKLVKGLINNSNNSFVEKFTAQFKKELSSDDFNNLQQVLNKLKQQYFAAVKSDTKNRNKFVLFFVSLFKIIKNYSLSLIKSNKNKKQNSGTENKKEKDNNQENEENENKNKEIQKDPIRPTDVSHMELLKKGAVLPLVLRMFNGKINSSIDVVTKTVAESLATAFFGKGNNSELQKNLQNSLSEIVKEIVNSLKSGWEKEDQVVKWQKA